MPEPSAPLPPVTVSEHDGVRYLHLGSPWVQGAMRIRRPQVVELEYIRRMLAAVLWLPSASLGRGRAVQLGLGAGALTRFTAQTLRMPTTAVELNPQVIDVNRRWFHLPEDERLEIVQMDAGLWLREHCPPGSVRLLFVDLYDEEAAAPVLDTASFYADGHRALADGGVMSVNVFGRSSALDESLRRVAAAFGPEHVATVRATREGNTAVIAARGVPVPDAGVLRDRAAALQQRCAALELKAPTWPRLVHRYAEAVKS